MIKIQFEINWLENAFLFVVPSGSVFSRNIFSVNLYLLMTCLFEVEPLETLLLPLFLNDFQSHHSGLSTSTPFSTHPGASTDDASVEALMSRWYVDTNMCTIYLPSFTYLHMHMRAKHMHKQPPTHSLQQISVTTHMLIRSGKGSTHSLSETAQTWRGNEMEKDVVQYFRTEQQGATRPYQTLPPCGELCQSMQQADTGPWLLFFFQCLHMCEVWNFSKTYLCVRVDLETYSGLICCLCFTQTFLVGL